MLARACANSVWPKFGGTGPGLVISKSLVEQMPRLDGVEAVHRLREQLRDATPAAILVTAYGRDEAMNAAQSSGVRLDPVLTKPVTLQSMATTLARALQLEVAVEEDAAVGGSNEELITAGLSGLRLLLVQDNEMNQELAVELPSQAGIEVMLAQNGQIALDTLGRPAAFDGVLMDRQMPVMHGYMASRLIRADARSGEGAGGGDVRPHLQAPECTGHVCHDPPLDDARKMPVCGCPVGGGGSGLAGGWTCARR